MRPQVTIPFCSQDPRNKFCYLLASCWLV